MSSLDHNALDFIRKAVKHYMETTKFECFEDMKTHEIVYDQIDKKISEQISGKAKSWRPIGHLDLRLKQALIEGK